MLKQKVYKANLYGIGKDFTINSDNIKNEIFINKKYKLTTIYVVKFLNGYKEIITGRYYSKYIIKKSNEVVFNKDERYKVISTTSPIFIFDDMKSLDGYNLTEANINELKQYLSETNADDLNSKLNILEYYTYNCFNQALLNYKKGLKPRKRMK